jgi:hypothetical protein
MDQSGSPPDDINAKPTRNPSEIVIKANGAATGSLEAVFEAV